MAGFFNPHTFENTPISQPEKIAQCGKCGLLKLCKSPQMPVSGRGKRKILFVAEAPGREEDLKNTQLIGESGQLLRDILSSINIRLDDCWKTNAIICRPPYNKIENYMIDCCRPNLMKTIKELKPNVIVALGSSALESLLYKIWGRSVGAISQWVGYTIPTSRYNAWICPTYHPSFLLRMNNDRVVKRMMRDHLKAAIKLEHVKPNYVDVESLKSSVELIFDPKQAYLRMKDLAQKKGFLAFDYETTGLKPERKEQKIISCSFCLDGEDTFAFMMDPRLKGILSKVLRNGDLKKIASNLKFEERWTIQKLGHHVAGWFWDTMQTAHIQDNRPKITSIKFQSFVHLGVGDYDSHVSPYLKARGGANGLNSIRKMDPRELLIYNGMDSLLEYMIMRKQYKIEKEARRATIH